MNSPPIDIFGRVVLGLAFAVVYPRLFFGIEFFDEAYYLALPVSFASGYQPFLDEHAVHQFAALLIQPFVSTYLYLVGSTDGLVLFGRHLYFACGVLAVWAVRGFWTRAQGERTGNLLAAVALTYIPLCIISLSYNSIVYFGLLAGSSLIASAALGRAVARHMAVGTLCMGAVAFAYPTMLPVATIAIAGGLGAVHATCSADDRKQALLWTGVAVAGVFVGSSAILLILDFPAALGSMLDFSQAQGAQGGGAVKWKAISLEFRFQLKLFAALATVLLIVSLGVARGGTVRLSMVAAALLWPALAAASTTYRQFHAPFTTVPYVLAIIGLAAPVVLLRSKERFARPERIAGAIVTVTSIAATVAILWSTANGLRNAAIGLTPAALAALGCLAANRSEGEAKGGGTASVPFTIFIVSLIFFQAHQLWTHAYREFVPSELEQTVDRGPWKGIKTTTLKILFMNELRDDLERIRGDAETVIFFDYFPAGYLMSDLRPRTPGLWMFPNSRIFQGTTRLRNVYAKRLEAHGSMPDVAVEMICIPAQPFTWMRLPEGDAVGALFDESAYETVLERPCYSIARRRGEAGPTPPR
ncbi:MAG: hypothetical protein QF570_11710 [Myxococcota bacterium]|nr:hypothetical protein [Myxococcota bacterium]